jgi:hypothetical protein
MKRTIQQKSPRNYRDAAGNEALSGHQVKARLDAIILLVAGMRFSDEKGVLKLAPVAKLLHKAGFTPTEIAKFLGKKKATDVSKYLY